MRIENYNFSKMDMFMKNSPDLDIRMIGFSNVLILHYRYFVIG